MKEGTMRSIIIGLTSLAIALILFFMHGCVHSYRSYYECHAPKMFFIFHRDGAGEIVGCETCDMYRLKSIKQCYLRKYTQQQCQEMFYNVDHSCRAVR